MNEERHDRDDTSSPKDDARENSAADAGSESPEEGAAAMDAAEEASHGTAEDGL